MFVLPFPAKSLTLRPHPAESSASSLPAATARFQMLDVWRGLVCLLVVVEHVGVALWSTAEGLQGASAVAWWWAFWLLTRNLGTPLFFVMSGYCIAATLDSARRKGTSPAAFLARRLWRIVPTYWAALLVFVVFVLALDAMGLELMHQGSLSLGLPSPKILTRGQWLGNLTLTETWRPIVSGGESVVFTRVAWSLCYQEQFYLVCVLALWLAPRRLDAALAIATAAILVFRAAAADTGWLFRFEGTFPVLWHEFAVGLAVYWALNRPAGATPAGRWGVGLGLLALGTVGWWTELTSTAAAAGFGLVLIGLKRWDAAAGACRWLDPIRACGRRSYSIYLIHLPVSIAGNEALSQLGLTGFWGRLLVLVPVVTIAAVAAGWAFHRLVESHFLGQPPLPRLEAAPGARLALAPILARPMRARRGAHRFHND